MVGCGAGVGLLLLLSSVWSSLRNLVISSSVYDVDSGALDEVDEVDGFSVVVVVVAAALSVSWGLPFGWDSYPDPDPDDHSQPIVNLSSFFELRQLRGRVSVLDFEGGFLGLWYVFQHPERASRRKANYRVHVAHDGGPTKLVGYWIIVTRRGMVCMRTRSFSSRYSLRQGLELES